MERLDQSYLTDLVRQAAEGSSNAYAELFAAVCRRQYGYLVFMTGDEPSARILLTHVHTHALESLPLLPHPEMFLPWIARLCLRAYVEQTEHTDGLHPETEIDTPAGRYTVSTLLNLPLTESQVLLMRYGQGLREEDIAVVLNFSQALVRRALRIGLRHLRKGEESDTGAAQPARLRGARMIWPELSVPEICRLLEEIFDAAGKEPNTMPVEALASYAVYRKERFSLQRGVLVSLLVMFFLLPVIFIPPVYELSVEDTGLRGLPVVTIRIASRLPVNRVIAKWKQHSLPVYEAGKREFTVEPTRNGELTITVELINRQKAAQSVNVTAVDAEGPRLLENDFSGELIRFVVEDAGIGVDYAEAYAMSASGMYMEPVSYNAAAGEIYFPYPEENWDVYIPDHIGNTLHLSLAFQ